MTEDNYYSGCIQEDFEDIAWQMTEDKELFLSGRVEIEYSFARYDSIEDWSLEDIELNFESLKAVDIEGEDFPLDKMDQKRAEAYLLGHKGFNDWVDAEVNSDFDWR
jgi:hypothetical protein